MHSQKFKTKPRTFIITIDGPAGAGKSTLAKQLAQALRIAYLDTGAMYRALTLKALRQNIPLEDEKKLIQLAQKTTIELTEHNGQLKIMLDGEDVTQAIRSVDVTNNTFYIARVPQIREIMVGWQRSIGEKKSVVVEGRDTGTVVFPQAKYKFYLDADLGERSSRRLKDLKLSGQEIDPQHLTKELKERDNKDMTRKVGPLKKAEEAVYIDSTHMSPEEVLEVILKHIQNGTS